MAGFVNILKLCVGADSVEDLTQWQDAHSHIWPKGRAIHVTRMWPKREAEVLAGGSLFWVIKGQILARQRILGLERVEGADGIKSGFTNQAGFGFLGSAERDGRRLVSIVAGSPTGRMQKAASRAFLEWGFRSFEGHPLFDQGEVVGEARVQGGSARTVPLIAQRPIGYDLPVGQTAKVTLSIRYEGPLRAPIAAGQEVAVLEVTAPGIAPARIPLYAAEAVEVAGPLDRVINERLA